jgi:COP9 signalosome complex subunit 4
MYVIDKLHARSALFPREDGIFKRELAVCLDTTGDSDGAIRVLSSIQYENGDEQIIDKIDDYLTLAEIWLDRDDSTQAEIYVNRASHCIYHDKVTPSLQFRYKRAFVMVSDAKRDYTNAAQGYYNLSTNKTVTDQDGLFYLFNLGLACAILAPAGPRKDRQLTLIMKDERSKLCEHYDLL